MSVFVCLCVGIAGLFAIFSSFVFGTTVVSIIDSQVSGLK